MSALSGILYADKRPIPQAVLEALSHRNAQRGPDRTGAFLAPGVTLQHHALHIDRHASLEIQPVHLPNGDVLAWDGRLDNRDDLQIRLHSALERDATDVALVAAAYARWGLDVLPMLVGDWSLVIWHAHDETVTLARDYVGNRPLYYRQSPDAFVWSTCLETLVDMFDLHEDVDESYVAGVLTFGAPVDATPFRTVVALQAAHRITVRRDLSARTTRFWNFSPATVRYARREEYAEHLRHLLTEAVRVRLRASGPVWSHLSGGYDSSAIVCLAHPLVRAGAVQSPALRTVSKVFTKSPESDEQSFIRAVERWCGLESLLLDKSTESCTLADLMADRRPFARTGLTSLMRLIRESGGHVLLSGELGDLVMGQSEVHASGLLEPLHELRLAAFARSCIAWSWRSRMSLWQVGLNVALAHRSARQEDMAFRRRRLTAACKVTGGSARSVASAFGLRPEFVARLRPEPRDLADELVPFPLSKRPILRALHWWASTGALMTPDTLPEMRFTYPYVHRPLVEYILAIPQAILWRAETTRALMREALADVLPEAVLNRRNKGYAAAAATRAYRPLAMDLLNEQTTWEIVERGYVDESSFRRQLESVMDSRINTTGLLHVRIALEAWFRSMRVPHGRVRAA